MSVAGWTEVAPATSFMGAFEAAGSKIIIVESEIGAGKSTLLPALAEGLERRGWRPVLVYEPVDEWSGILEKFYADPARWAYAFQTFVYSTRIAAIRRAVAAARAAPSLSLAPLVFVLERSPITDEIFMELQRGAVADVEMEMYEVWRRTFAPLLPIDLAKAAVLYLKPDLDTCMRRIAQRSRVGEVAKSKDVKGDVAKGDVAKGDDSKGDVAKGDVAKGDDSKGKDAKSDDSVESSGISFEYQARLRRAHEALLQGLHADEFPRLANRPPPYPRSAVAVLAANIAGLNFRDAGAEREAVVDHALRLLGFIKK